MENSRDYMTAEHFKNDILSTLYKRHPEHCIFTEDDYGCSLFNDAKLYLHPDSDDAINVIEKSALLTKSFMDLKLRGYIHSNRISHMSWLVKLTPFGYQTLHGIHSSLDQYGIR